MLHTFSSILVLLALTAPSLTNAAITNLQPIDCRGRLLPKAVTAPKSYQPLEIEGYVNRGRVIQALGVRPDLQDVEFIVHIKNFDIQSRYVEERNRSTASFNQGAFLAAASGVREHARLHYTNSQMNRGTWIRSARTVLLVSHRSTLTSYVHDYLDLYQIHITDSRGRTFEYLVEVGREAASGIYGVISIRTPQDPSTYFNGIRPPSEEDGRISFHPEEQLVRFTRTLMF